jgi:hypothetical protein
MSLAVPDEITNFLSQHGYGPRDGTASHVWDLGLLANATLDSGAKAIGRAHESESATEYVARAHAALFSCLRASVAHVVAHLAQTHKGASVEAIFLADGEEQTETASAAPVHIARLARAFSRSSPGGIADRHFTREAHALAHQLVGSAEAGRPYPPHVACIGLLVDAVACLDDATPSGTIVAGSDVVRALRQLDAPAPAGDEVSLAFALTVAGAIVLFGNAPRHFSDAAVVYRGSKWRTLREFRVNDAMWPAYAVEPRAPAAGADVGAGARASASATTFDLVVAIPGGRRYATAILCEAAES